MDAFGHINNVMFLKYVQSSRVNYWEQIGLTNYHKETGIGPLLAATSIQFKKQLNYPGDIEINAGVVKINNTSFQSKHIIIDDEGDICAEAEDVIVLFDFNKNEKVNCPDWLREKMEAVEKKSL